MNDNQDVDGIAVLRAGFLAPLMRTRGFGMTLWKKLAGG
jgi:hypothetical protein